MQEEEEIIDDVMFFDGYSCAWKDITMATGRIVFTLIPFEFSSGVDAF